MGACVSSSTLAASHVPRGQAGGQDSPSCGPQTGAHADTNWLQADPSFSAREETAVPARKPNFPLLAPMLVMRFSIFVEQGRIPRSDEAHARGLLEEFNGSAHVAIFISHEWWQTPDTGGGSLRRPDHSTGDKANLKFRLLSSGIKQLIDQRGIDRSRVVLWMDWFSISQDDADLKLKGVGSLVKYTTLCSFMLIPCQLRNLAISDIYQLPGYGQRAWCRCECFIFVLWQKMVGAPVEVLLEEGDKKGRYSGARDAPHQAKVAQLDAGIDAMFWDQSKVTRLYTINLDEELRDWQQIIALREDMLPAAADLSVETDRALIRDLQEEMLAAYLSAVIRRQCAPGSGVDMNLRLKALGDRTMPELVGALRGLQQSMVGMQWQYIEDDVFGKHDVAHMQEIRSEQLAAALQERMSLSRQEVQRLDLPALSCQSYIRVGGARYCPDRKALNRLDISGNPRLTAAGFAELASFLNSDEALEKLSVKHGMDASGAAALVRGLANNRGLQVLKLRMVQGVGASSAGWVSALAGALAAHPALRKLCLDEDSIEDAGACALAQALQTNSVLRVLSLSDNEVTDSGAAALAQALRGGGGGGALERLDLSYNRLTHFGQAALCAAAGDLVHVSLECQEIDLGHTPRRDGDDEEEEGEEEEEEEDDEEEEEEEEEEGVIAAIKDSRPALIVSAEEGHDDHVRQLLAARADVQAVDEDGEDALMVSAREGHDTCVHHLLAAKADAVAAGTNGSTALMLSAMGGHDACARQLLAARADVQAVDEDGSTALMLSAMGGHDACARQLLAARADVQAVDNVGNSALYYANLIEDEEKKAVVLAVLAEHGLM